MTATRDDDVSLKTLLFINKVKQLPITDCVCVYHKAHDMSNQMVFGEATPREKVCDVEQKPRGSKHVASMDTKLSCEFSTILFRLWRLPYAVDLPKQLACLSGQPAQRR